MRDFPEQPFWHTDAQGGVLKQLLKESQKDNAPWLSSGNYGKSGKPTYYFQDKPGEAELWYQSHNSPLGYRLTYGVAKDVYLNEFALRFPNTDLDIKTIGTINQQIRIHLRKIDYFRACKLRCGFRREQGEAILIIYRKGDGAELISYQNPANINYQAFKNPAPQSKDILYVEAVSKYDYFLPAITSLGRAEGYRILFWGKQNTKNYYEVDPSRVLRSKNDDIEYDQYEQQSSLRACFSELQILNMIERAMGYGAHRWGTGMPAFFTQGVSPKNVDIVKTAIGNPMFDDFMILPKEFITDMKMLGTEGTPINLGEMGNFVVEQIAAVQQIPTPILMGRVAGVVEGSIVNERQYYSTLIREQTSENDYHRAFFDIDPFIQGLFKKYNIEDYEFDWGLRQEMTKVEQAELDMKKASVGISYMNFLTYNEIRNFLGRCKLEEIPEFKKNAPSLYNLTAEQLGNHVPNFGLFKQEVTRQLIQTPEEERELEQLESGQNKPENVTKMKNKDPSTKEAERREVKSLTKEAGGGQSGENSVDKQQLVNELVNKLVTKDIVEKLIPATRNYSKTKLAKMAGCSSNDITRLIEALEKTNAQLSKDPQLKLLMGDKTDESNKSE